MRVRARERVWMLRLRIATSRPMCGSGLLSCDFERADLLEQLPGVGVPLKVVAHRLQDAVDGRRDSGLEVRRVHLALPLVVPFQVVRGRVGYRARVLDVHAERPGPRQHDVADVLEDGVALDLPGRAEGLLDLGVDLLLAVLHENGALGVRLGHLLLALLETRHHAVRQDDRLELALGLAHVAVLPGEHVDLALVHAQLADVGAEEEDVRTLHDGVEDLRGCELVRLVAAHDLGAPDDALEVVLDRNVHHERPVLGRVPVDLLRGPQELHFAEVHPHGLPDLNHVLPHHPDLLQVAVHLVVQLRKPVCDPELEGAARLGQLVHVQRFHHPLRNVHPPGRLEPVVGDRGGPGLEERHQIVVLHALLRHGPAQLESLL